MNKKSSLFFLVGVGLAVFHTGAACTSTAPPLQEPTDVPTSVPAPTSTTPPTALPAATPTPTEEKIILFHDDFSDPDSGWEQYREWDGVLDYEEGSYRMWVNVSSNFFWVNAGLDFSDVRIEIEATKQDGPDANQFGVMCRFDPKTYDFYIFIITSDGKFGIGKVIGDAYEVELLGNEELENSDAIRQGAELNYIRADCVGNNLALYANGELLLEIQDDDLVSGDVGLIAGTFELSGTDILFDNLFVLEP